MDQQAAAKQQVVERIKQANNILVTVSNDPSVDQLSACIGMALFLNKLNKSATAVFSGKVPPAIDFLQPEKTLEQNTDSLRDFIISLDKSKADKLRYKVEDKYVRIYITPYRTRISNKDLEFSEGDFNVEVILALGVRDKEHLDGAITAHGRILHSATIISISAGEDGAANLGQINWHDASASSLCEMLMSISESFGTGLIDNQIATAFLTGIVAETNRFSNTRTSPKVMTMAAQLMAAGANQQLIVSKLEPPPPPNQPPPAPPPKPPAPKPPKPKPLKPEDEIDVAHEGKVQGKAEMEISPLEIRIDEEGNLSSAKAPEAQPQTPSAPAVPPMPEPAVTPTRPYLNQPPPTSGFENASADVLTKPSPVDLPSGRPNAPPSQNERRTWVDEIGLPHTETPAFILPGQEQPAQPPPPGSDIAPVAPPPLPPPLSLVRQ